MLTNPSSLKKNFSDEEYFIGLMSGTSLDGIDGSIIKTDGLSKIASVENLFLSFPAGVKANILRAIKAAKEKRFSAHEIEDAKYEFGKFQLNLVRLLLQKANKKPSDIFAIGSHGQTILHISKKISPTQKSFSLQIDAPNILFDNLGIAVIYDFRQNDVENYGEGAPLSPIYHMVKSFDIKKNIAVINIGGVANITFIDKEKNIENIIAFDCGPGNGMIDKILNDHNIPYDKDGELALAGNVNIDILQHYQSHNFFNLDFPKSLDRYDFIPNVSNLPLRDACATLAQLTVEGIKKAIKDVENYNKQEIELVILTGGGRKNNYFMQKLSKYYPKKIINCDELGWDGDFAEAECFAYLAARSIKSLPLSFPLTTGVRMPVSGGKLYFK